MYHHPSVRRLPLLLAATFVLLGLQHPIAVGQSPTTGKPSPTKTPLIVPPRRLPSDQELVAPFWTLEPGWSSQLEVRNNLGAVDLDVTPILRTSDGAESALPAVKLRPDQVETLDLPTLASSLNGRANSYGSISLRYKSVSRGNLYAAVLVQRLGHPITMHFDAVPVDSVFASGTREGIWWLPQSTADGFLIVSNVSPRAVNAQQIFTDGKNTSSTPVSLKPYQTYRVSIRDTVQRAGFTATQGGLRMSFGADAGSVYVSELLFDETAEFSALMKVFERDPKTQVETITLRAPLVGLSAPDAVLAYPANVILRPTLFLRNASSTKTDATIQVAWKSPTATGSIPLAVRAIAPEETRLVDLTALRKQGLPADANWANVSLTYLGRPGDLVPIAASYDLTTRYGLQSPFSSSLSSMWKGGMWHVDPLHDSLITTGNAGKKDAKIAITLFYGQNGVYEVTPKSVPPEGQIWLDVGELIRDQIPDSRGKVLPPETMEGSYEIKDLSDSNIGYLYEGKVITDETFGHATYGCGSCCGYDDSYMLPDPMIGPMGFSGNMVVYGVNACTGQGIALGGAYNWKSSSPPIATVTSSGYVTMVSPGTSSISSYINLRTAGVNNCPPLPYSQGAPANSTPRIDSIDPGSALIGSNGVQITINGAGFGTSPTVNLPSGFTSTGQGSQDTKIVIIVNIANTATVGNNSLTVTASGLPSNAATFAVDGPYHMIVQSDVTGLCSGCHTAVSRLVTYQIQNFTGTNAGTTQIGESPSFTGWNCTQSESHAYDQCSGNVYSNSSGAFSDQWSIGSDVYSPAGCGFNVTDHWQWCGHSPAQTLGTLTGYIHTDKILINGVLSPSGMTPGTVVPF